MSDNRSRQEQKVLVILLYAYPRAVKYVSFAFAEENRCVYITPEIMLPVMKYRCCFCRVHFVSVGCLS